MVDKEEKGVTLIALIVTIIVMIILSTILIKATDGIDPITNAVDKTEGIYLETKEETEENITAIERKWENIIYKNTIDNTMTY